MSLTKTSPVSHLATSTKQDCSTAAQGKRDAKTDIKSGWVEKDFFESKKDLAKHLEATLGASKEYIDAYHTVGCIHFKLRTA